MGRCWTYARPLLCLLAILFFAYLPLSTFVFGMKNDAFSDNFPPKFFLSQCLHAGVLPLWNPYMNFGFPVYADMGFAFYNPIVWLFALIGYNAYTLTLEVLLYLYIAGVAMYCLGRCLQFRQPVALAVAAMYMCCGVLVGGLQHINALAAAAFLPFLLQGTWLVLQRPCYRTCFRLSVAAYMVCASGHPAIPIAAFYFLALFVLVYFLARRRQLIGSIAKVSGYLLLSAALLVCYLLPAVYSYLAILPEYSRYVQNTPYNPIASASLSGVVSFLFPFATASHSAFFDNDVSFRNFYISLAGIAAVGLGVRSKHQLVLPLLIAGLVLFFLSLGYPARAWLFDKLPLLQTVRTNGHFRIFLLLSFCCISGFGFEKGLLQAPHSRERFYGFVRWSILVLVLCFVALCLGWASELYLFFRRLLLPAGLTQSVKSFYGFLSLPVALFISLFIAIVVVLFVARAKRLSANTILVVVVADLVVNTALYLPVTGVGTTTVSSIQSVYSTSPPGIPVPPLQAVQSIDTLPSAVAGLTGSLSYYNKKIGTLSLTDYPSFFTTTEQYFSSPDTAVVQRQPYLFLQSRADKMVQAETGTIRVLSFAPTRITLRVHATQHDTLVYLQNSYRFWKALVDGKPTGIHTAYTAFLSVDVPAGTHTVSFVYDDGKLMVWAILAWLVFCAALLFYAKLGQGSNILEKEA